MDSYYKNEDETETPEMQIDNFRAQQTAALAVDTYAESSLVELQGQAEVIWNAAAERGDIDTQNRVVEMYNTAKHLKDTVLYSNEAQKGILAAAEVMAAKAKKAEEEYDELVEAIGNADTDNRLVRDLVEQVEQNAYEYAGEGMYEDAWEGATESIYEDFYSTLRQLSPSSSYFTMERVISALRGEVALNDIQRGLLLSLINTFTVESKAS